MTNNIDNQRSIKNWTDSHKISLIIPCYNEFHRINLLVNGLQEWAKGWTGKSEIIIVDDGSSDATSDAIHQNKEIQKIQDSIPVKIISYEVNRGKGYALKQGMEAASGDFILTLDADMSARPLALLKWLTLLNHPFTDHTIYIGSREDPESQVKDRQGRRIAGRTFNFIIRVLTPLKMHDTQCGFKLYPKPIAKNLFRSLQTIGWAHDVEILYRALQNQIEIVSLPLNYKVEQGTKINMLKDSYLMFLQVWKIRKLLR